tara:strand:- start:2561 stop:3073 length:513 start_codon:yes stop_codon:yes gene_type:complete
VAHWQKLSTHVHPGAFHWFPASVTLLSVKNVREVSTLLKKPELCHAQTPVHKADIRPKPVWSPANIVWDDAQLVGTPPKPVSHPSATMFAQQGDTPTKRALQQSTTANSVQRDGTRQKLARLSTAASSVHPVRFQIRWVLKQVPSAKSAVRTNIKMNKARHSAKDVPTSE